MSEADRLAAVLALRDEVAQPMARLKTRCQEKLKQLSSATPSVLYHYTDTKGFMGIISKNTLWSTRIDFLNDSSEIPYARQLFEKRIAHHRQKCDDDEGKLLDWITAHYDFVREYFKVYAISLSSRHDDLSQWRGYADRLGGYSIGFDFTTIPLATSLFEARKELEPRIVEMTYQPDKQIECLDDMIEQVLGLYRSLVTKASEDTIGNLRRFISQDVINLVADNFIRFKNPAFADEKE
jgi:hypothetical protein